MSIKKTGTEKGDDIKPNVFKKRLTVLEQDNFALQIQQFFGEKQVPTYVKFKIGEFLNHQLMPTVKSYFEAKEELIKKLGKDGRIHEFTDKEGKKPNPKYKEYLQEIESVEKDKKELTFEKLPLSAIIKVDMVGYPRVYELFYEDANAKKAFEKMLADQAEEEKTD